jgi:hypothetical protein
MSLFEREAELWRRRLHLLRRTNEPHLTRRHLVRSRTVCFRMLTPEACTVVYQYHTTANYSKKLDLIFIFILRKGYPDVFAVVLELF